MSDLRLPPVDGTMEEIMKALLKTPPPPAGDRSTRKQPPGWKKRAPGRTHSMKKPGR